MTDESKPVVVEYHRLEQAIHVRLSNLSNHELREVITGLWLRLDDEDRRDHIHALQHYMAPESTPSPVAQAVHLGTEAPGVTDLRKYTNGEHDA